MAKHIHVHVGKTQDALPSAQVSEAIRKAEAIIHRLKNVTPGTDLADGDFREGYKALTAAYNWIV